MNLYNQSYIFLLFHLLVTIFLFFIIGSKFQEHANWLVIISIIIGAIIQIDNKFSSGIIVLILAINWIVKKRKSVLIIINVIIWITCANLESLLNYFSAGETYSNINLKLINFNTWILILFFVNQINLIKSSKETKNPTTFLLYSFLPLMAFPLPFCSKSKHSLSTVLRKEKMHGFNYFCLALVFKFFFITTFETWSQIGIHAGFSLNMGQSWALLIFNLLSIIFNVIYIFLITKGCSVIFSPYKDTSKTLEEELIKKIVSPFYKIIGNNKSFIFKSLIITLGILLFLSLHWYQLIGIIPLLMIYSIFHNNKSKSSKLIKILIIALLSLFITVNTFIELKVMLIGLINISSLFVYYNEYFIFHAFKAEPFTCFFLVILTIIFFKKRDYFYQKSKIKHSIIILILYPLLALIQLS